MALLAQRKKFSRGLLGVDGHGGSRALLLRFAARPIPLPPASPCLRPPLWMDLRRVDGPCRRRPLRGQGNVLRAAHGALADERRRLFGKHLVEKLGGKRLNSSLVAC